MHGGSRQWSQVETLRHRLRAPEHVRPPISVQGECEARTCLAARTVSLVAGRTKQNANVDLSPCYTRRRQLEIELAHPQERAWSEGHKAGKSDRLRTSCPYNKGVMQQAWLAGWGEGQKSKNAKDA